MAKRRSTQQRAKRPPKVAYTLLSVDENGPLYHMLHELIDRHHDELRDARIALAFYTGWRHDLDGHIVIGKVKRASDLDRELHDWDFVVLLSKEFVEHEQTTEIQIRALIDHELQHCALREDPDTGDPQRDERGRIRYRLRRHDLEEFDIIAKRWGLYRRELETFAKALAQAPGAPRLPLDEDDTPPHHLREVH